MGGCFPNNIGEAESLREAMDAELGIIEGGVGNILRPFSLPKPTIVAANGPIGDAIDDPSGGQESQIEKGISTFGL